VFASPAILDKLARCNEIARVQREATDNSRYTPETEWGPIDGHIIYRVAPAPATARSAYYRNLNA
jgi:hypothetical protein